jgi:ribosomal protein S18 acetylase RimI-like enzyme
VGDLFIKAVTEADIDALLPLVADYQRFYGVDAVDDAANRRFFLQFAGDAAAGIQHLAFASGEAVGFTTLYFGFCSIEAAPVATLYDLYVVPQQRGAGIGRALMENAAQVARARGMRQMAWFTAPDNVMAQRLYDSIASARSEWIQYSMDLDAW